MFCFRCGKEIEDESAFCKHCGTNQTRKAKAPPSGKKSKGKHLSIGAGIMAALLVAALIIMNMAGVIHVTPSSIASSQTISALTTFEGPGFDTPEEAAAAYVEALKSMDIRRIWSACAIESFVEHCDFIAYTARFRAYHPQNLIFAPPSNDFSYMVNLWKRLGDVFPPHAATMEITGGKTISFTGEELFVSASFGGSKAMTLPQFAELLEDFFYGKQSQLENMVVTDIVLPGNLEVFAKTYGISKLFEVYTSELSLANLDRMRLCYGADDLIDVIVVLTIDGEEYVMMPQLVQYEGKWRAFSYRGQMSSLCNIVMYAYLIRMADLQQTLR